MPTSSAGGAASSERVESMLSTGQIILDNLAAVAAERALRSRDCAMGAMVDAIKRYQHARFEKTYADLLASPRYRRAARFFLEDLYGPHDFAERDAQFVRVVPALVRLFPGEIVETVAVLAQLHALSERLDTAMARSLGALPAAPACTAQRYAAAWQAVGEMEARERQVSWMLGVGQALDRFTRNPVLRQSLRFMRVPARAAGLGALQQFLEQGFDTFREMRGAGGFLDVVASRERALARRLFDTPAEALATGSAGVLGELP